MDQLLLSITFTWFLKVTLDINQEGSSALLTCFVVGLGPVLSLEDTCGPHILVVSLWPFLKIAGSRARSWSLGVSGDLRVSPGVLRALGSVFFEECFSSGRWERHPQRSGIMRWRARAEDTERVSGPC